MRNGYQLDDVGTSWAWQEDNDDEDNDDDDNDDGDDNDDEEDDDDEDDDDEGTNLAWQGPE